MLQQPSQVCCNSRRSIDDVWISKSCAEVLCHCSIYNLPYDGVKNINIISDTGRYKCKTTINISNNVMFQSTVTHDTIHLLHLAQNYTNIIYRA